MAGSRGDPRDEGRSAVPVKGQAGLGTKPRRPYNSVGKSPTAEAELLLAETRERVPESGPDDTVRTRLQYWWSSHSGSRGTVPEMNIEGARKRRPDYLPGMGPDESVPASRTGLRAVGHAAFVVFGILVLLPSGDSHGAEVVPHCEAKRYKPCPSFLTSVSIGDHVEIIDNAIAGMTRSKGSWTIDVRYQPSGSCAIVKMLLNIGPIDPYRSYERVFTDGGGQIGDGGYFMHKMGSPDTSLTVDSSSCYIPAEEPTPGGGQPSHSGAGGESNKLDELLERLARGEQGELRDLDEQFERLAAEERRSQEAARERERQRRLAERQRQRERERERLARQQREELNRLLAQRQLERERRRRERNEQAATDAMMTGLAMGLMSGALDMLGKSGGGSFNPAALATLQGSAGGGCERIGENLARNLERVNELHSDSTCGMARGMAGALTQARNELVAKNCASSSELADMDRSIREAQATARASCGGN